MAAAAKDALPLFSFFLQYNHGNLQSHPHCPSSHTLGAYIDIASARSSLCDAT